ncbi:MAG: L-rhamnose isomerase, partial [Clostridia bacterium]|nr:L-rhamnose isomerase [Clostridia bacterium]
ACEIHRGGYERRVNIGLDFFDGSINRIAAWTMGTRNMQKALLWANLEPVEMLQKFELEGDYTSRLAYLEELKTLPFGLVWNAYCDMQGVPAGDSWIPMMKKYEADVLSAR